MQKLGGLMSNRKVKKAEEERLKQTESEKERHKCNGCKWGTWEGNTMRCMFPKCFKNKTNT